MRLIKNTKQHRMINPVIIAYDRMRIFSALLKALKVREKELPGEVLNNFLEKLYQKRETFLKSTNDLGTPQYFYDKKNLLTQITLFHEAFIKNLPRFRSFYAVKSNSFLGIINDVVASGMGLDTSSGRELSMALETGCKKILFSGPGKTDEELILALKNRKRVVLLLDSFNELRRLSSLIKRESVAKDVIEVGIRVHASDKDPWNKFGISINDLPVIMEKAIRVKGISPCGIQFHSSWNLDPSRQISMIDEISSFLSKYLSKYLLGNLRFLDIGGGFWPEHGEWLNPQNTLIGKLAQQLGVEYHFRAKHYYYPSNPIDKFAKNIANALLTQPSPISDLEIFMEPGRWISNSSMHILLKVIDQKSKDTFITDGGINLIGWERPMNEFIPVINLTHFSKRELSTRIYGPLCTPDDIWGYSVFGNKIEIGDILLVPDQGAYTYSLRQSFIKPISRVVGYNGSSIKELDGEYW
ncbi:diaminopimelate decarboxylase family protein [Thermodesulfobacteriota bacterium]